jgi:hypothetical protein
VKVNMTLAEFKALAQAWGADIGRWPEDTRAAGACLACKPEAAAILAEAEHIDELIGKTRPEISAARVDQAISGVLKVIAAAALRTTTPSVLLPHRWWLIPAASFACAAILGVSIGLMRPLNTSRNASRAPALTMILDNGPFGPDWVFR